jgi:hypothetical protein
MGDGVLMTARPVEKEKGHGLYSGKTIKNKLFTGGKTMGNHGFAEQGGHKEGRMIRLRRHHKLLLLMVALSIGMAFPVFGETGKRLTTKEVIFLQNLWGDGIVTIGKVFQAGEDYKTAAREMIAKVYGYDEGSVLFKPTKAAADQFRETADQAHSYFVGGAVPEDHGFAIQPWSAVRFENHEMVIGKDMAVVMGNYYFTDAGTGDAVKVEFTLGIKRAKDSRPVIFLHHSSLPYQPVP